MQTVTKHQLDLDFAKKFEPTKLPERSKKGLALWEGSTLQCAANGQRFCKQFKRETEGAGTLITLVPKREDEITKDERKFWVMNDKSWAWHCWLFGSDIKHIVDHVGGTREEFTTWMLAVCRGEKRCIYAGNWAPSYHPWTPRQDKMLLYMKKHKLEWNTACRLLGRAHHFVQARLNEVAR